MERQYPDLANSLEWNLVARGNYSILGTSGGTFARLPRRYYPIADSSVLAIGITTYPSKGSWFTGGWATQFLQITPSSTSEFTTMRSHRHWLQLNLLTMVEFPKLQPSWILELSFPYWLESVGIEVWKYDGQDFAWYDLRS